MSAPQSVPQQSIPVGGSGGVGSVTINPPTFLERWGVAFVSIGGLWMLVVAACLLGYYLKHLSLPPAPAGSAADYKTALELHKSASDQFRDSFTFVFDLMVTKTILPLVTLLLGYLFGSKRV